MINAININDKKQSSPNKTSIFYVNDVHGKMTNMERIYTASRDFDSFEPQDKTDKLKLASGDIILGEDYKSNLVAHKFLNWVGFIQNDLGNHEWDATPSRLSKFLESAKYKLLSANVNVSQSSPLAGKIQKSIIYEENGNKYGIIGISPSDMKDRIKTDDSPKEFTVDDITQTVKDVQEEVDKLKKQGVNRIILTSHSGYLNDIRIAKETTGIDIIDGGHSHDLIKGIVYGKNLFTSKNGEPVIITQAGKDGEYVGVLNVEWDKNGIITKAQNNVTSTRDTYNRTLPMKYAVEQILGKPEIVGRIGKAVPPPKNRLIEPNPHAYFITDAMKNELGTDIAILNAANIRGNFTEDATVDTRLMADITPFKNNMVIANISEPLLVNAIKTGAKSMNSNGNKPGLIVPSGLKYEVTKSGIVKNLRYIDKSGKEIPINIDNPNPNKYYRTALDDFCAMGGDNYFAKDDNPKFIEKKYSFDKDTLACNYLKKQKQPFDIKDDGRIKVVD